MPEGNKAFYFYLDYNRTFENYLDRPGRLFLQEGGGLFDCLTDLPINFGNNLLQKRLSLMGG